MKFALNPFVNRQRDPGCSFCHWEITDEELLRRISENWEKRRPGYRDGVVLVPVDPQGFKAAMRVLKEGDMLRGAYVARVPGEAPRKTLWYETGLPLHVVKTEPVSVDIVLYHKDTLAEDGEIVEAEWNIIAVLGKNCPAEEDEPMPPETLMANHFQDSGGTKTNMIPEQFEAALRRSYYYWKDKVHYK